MNERIIVYSLNVGDVDETGTVGDSAALVMMPIGATLIYVSVAPWEDDAGATMDVQDDGTDIVTAVDAAVHLTPGEWISTHANGTETPVAIAAGSEIELDFNSAAAANHFQVVLWFLSGESWG